jgi:hypothetical protein
MDDFDVYLAACEKAKGAGAIVRFGVCVGGEAGYFFPWNWPAEAGGKKPRPEIKIHRPHAEKGDAPTRGRNNGTAFTDVELRTELETFAHEYGHFVSWKGRTSAEDWLCYFEAAKKRSAVSTEFQAAVSADTSAVEFCHQLGETMQVKLTADERDMIMREETRAWEFGRELLVELGYEHLDEYDAHANRGLHHHRVRLGIERFAPDSCPICAAEQTTPQTGSTA